MCSTCSITPYHSLCILFVTPRKVMSCLRSLPKTEVIDVHVEGLMALRRPLMHCGEWDFQGDRYQMEFHHLEIHLTGKKLPHLCGACGGRYFGETLQRDTGSPHLPSTSRAGYWGHHAGLREEVDPAKAARQDPTQSRVVRHYRQAVQRILFGSQEMQAAPEASNAQDILVASDSSDAPEVTDANDVPDVMRATDASEVTDATDVPDVMQATDASEVTDATDVPNVMRVTDASDVINATGIPDVLDVQGPQHAPNLVEGSGATAPDQHMVTPPQNLDLGVSQRASGQTHVSRSYWMGPCSSLWGITWALYRTDMEPPRCQASLVSPWRQPLP